jgi:hypothetical protein
VRSVEEALTANRPAETGDTVGGIHFAFKLVIVGKFLVCEKLAHPDQ